MTRMPSELRDFLTIWVVGTILGVTMDVDMIFTRQCNRARLQVLVLDPALIPTSIDVVIGDNIYELHFKVEPDEMRDNPRLLDMEDDNSDIDAMDEVDDGKDVHEDFIQEDSGSKLKGKNVDLMPKKSHTEQQGRGKKFMSQKSIQNAPRVDEMMLVEDTEDEAMGELSNDEQIDGDHFNLLDNDALEPDSVCTSLVKESMSAQSTAIQQETVVSMTPTHMSTTDADQFRVVQQENVKVVTHVHSPAQMEAKEYLEVTTIPEASTPSRKSKRRAKTTDEHSLDRAE
jgi:hypothetical protein